MKKNKVNEILNVQAKRRKKIFNYSCLLAFIVSMICLFIALILNLNETYVVQYDEKSNVDYKVFLKDNEFYSDNYLEENSEYVVSLIDYIDAYFNYELDMKETDVSFNYKYNIDAELDIKVKDSADSLFKKKDVLLAEKMVSNYDSNELTLNENVKIDYNKYNDLVKKFVNVYALDDLVSKLIVRMYVNVLDNCVDGTMLSDSNEYVVELEIPLNVKTIDINMNSDVVDSNSKLMVCTKDDSALFIICILLIWFILIFIYVLYRFCKYLLNSRTPETVYDRELKKILNNYKSYIQKINTVVDFNSYKVLKVDTFTDMLEIRDTVQQPILMSEDKYNRGTYFMIPTNTNIMYVYGLKINDIKKELNKK